MVVMSSFNLGVAWIYKYRHHIGNNESSRLIREEVLSAEFSLNNTTKSFISKVNRELSFYYTWSHI